MLKGFKDFLLKGNVLDLAVAVVVGTAFTAIVTAFTDNIIDPLIASVGSADLGFGFQITDNTETFVNIGAVISAAINFVIIAAVVYFVLIVPYTHAKKRFSKDEVSASEATEIELLGEIRDLLADRGSVRES